MDATIAVTFLFLLTTDHHLVIIPWRAPGSCLDYKLPAWSGISTAHDEGLREYYQMGTNRLVPVVGYMDSSESCSESRILFDGEEANTAGAARSFRWSSAKQAWYLIIQLALVLVIGP